MPHTPSPSDPPFPIILVLRLLHSGKDLKFERIGKDNVVLLVVDHQVGLFQMTHDMQPDLFKDIANAAIDKVFNLSTILTTSAETGWAPICINLHGLLM